MSKIMEIKKLLETCYRSPVGVNFCKYRTREYIGTLSDDERNKTAFLHRSMSLEQIEDELKRAIKACEGIVGHQAFSDLEDFYKGLEYEVRNHG